MKYLMVQRVYVLPTSTESMEHVVNVQLELHTTKSVNYVTPTVRLMRSSATSPVYALLIFSESMECVVNAQLEPSTMQ